MDLIEVGYGVSRDDDAFAAGREAAGLAAGSIRTHAVSVVLVFAAVRYDLERLLQGIGSVTGDAPLVGITSAGEVCNGIQQGGAVVAIFASPHLRVSVGLGRKVSSSWFHAVEEAVAAETVRDLFTLPHSGIWPELTRSGESVFAMVFSPGAT